jgi:hypothetical protein
MSLNITKAKHLAAAATRGDLRALGSLLRLFIDELDPAESIVTIEADTTLNAETHGGKTIVLNDPDAALTVTLPPATGSGVKFRIVVGEVNTDSHVIEVTGDDTMDGNILTNSTGDTPDLAQFWPTAADSDTITLNGTTTGGAAIGDTIELEDIASNQWRVLGFTTSSGTEATPFSAAVS